MAYTAWSVIHGETPSAAKWNILGSNDAGFKDGTNIDDDAILARHIAAGVVGNSEVAAGFLVQTVSTQVTSRVSVGGTTMPSDDTIPQNTEGVEVMTLAITPKATTNILVIAATGLYGSAAARTVTQAIFQDTTADALAASAMRLDNVNVPYTIPTLHRMTAGTTSSTTFKVRSGPHGSTSTIDFNGDGAGARLYGGVSSSSLVIFEYKV